MYKVMGSYWVNGEMQDEIYEGEFEDFDEALEEQSRAARGYTKDLARRGDENLNILLGVYSEDERLCFVEVNIKNDSWVNEGTNKWN